MIRLASATALMCLIGAGSALALEPYLPRTPRVFASLDANADGKVTAAELQPKAERRFERMDADKNGEVSAAEIDAALQRLLVLRRDRILRHLDADANGVVAKAELDAYMERMLKAADANADGGVSLEEARGFKVAKAAR